MLFYCFTLLAQISPEPKNQQAIPLDVIIYIGMFMAVIYVVMRSTAKRTMKSRNRDTQSYKDIAHRQLRENPYHTIERLEELMAALADMSREINGQIDTRTAKLEILLGHADKKIETYKDFIKQEEIRIQELQNRVKHVAKETIPERETVINTENDVIADDETPTEPEPDTIRDYSDQSSTIDFRVTDNEITETEQAEPDNDKSQFLQTEQIITLAQKGLAMSDISRLTGRPSGEIELILNLSGFKGKKL